MQQQILSSDTKLVCAPDFSSCNARVWFRSQVHLPTRPLSPAQVHSGYDIGEAAGLFLRAHSGVHATMPLGKILLDKINSELTNQLNKIPAVEVDFPILQPLDWWLSESGSGRYSHFEQGLVKLCAVDRHYILSPSSEEMMIELVKSFGGLSYRDLPFAYHGTARRFRAESGGRGIHRGLEFLLHELYGFTASEASSRVEMQKTAQAYVEMFKNLGLNIVCSQPYISDANGHVALNIYAIETRSDSSRMERGTDEGVLYCAPCNEVAKVAVRKEEIANATEDCCPECSTPLEYKRALRIAQVASLGQIYSKSAGLNFTAADGRSEAVYSYAGGVSPQRVVLAIVEQYASEGNLALPPQVAPFEVEIVNLGKSSPMQVSNTVELAEFLKRAGMSVLVDDRDVSARKKFSDSDLLGAPFRILLGEKFDTQGIIELQDRIHNNTALLNRENIVESLLQALHLAHLQKLSEFKGDSVDRALKRLNSSFL